MVNQGLPVRTGKATGTAEIDMKSESRRALEITVMDGENLFWPWPDGMLKTIAPWRSRSLEDSCLQLHKNSSGFRECTGVARKLPTVPLLQPQLYRHYQSVAALKLLLLLRGYDNRLSFTVTLNWSHIYERILLFPVSCRDSQGWIRFPDFKTNSFPILPLTEGLTINTY